MIICVGNTCNDAFVKLGATHANDQKPSRFSRIPGVPSWHEATLMWPESQLPSPIDDFLHISSEHKSINVSDNHDIFTVPAVEDRHCSTCNKIGLFPRRAQSRALSASMEMRANYVQ